MKELLKALLTKYGFGELVGDILPVSGGLMHKMYKVQTERGTFAVKCLNPDIMKRPEVFDNYARAEALETILDNNGIPIVPALTFDGKKMVEVGGRYFYIFRWQKGHITDQGNISKEQCYKAGEILGKIHTIDVHNVEASEPELSAIDFRSYLKEVKQKESSIAVIFEESIELLEYAQDKLNEARKMLPAMKAISNDDMDPKNIMWDNGEPYVIDLECLGYSNPIASCLDLSLQWAGTVNQSFSRENLSAFFNGYLSAYDNGFRSYDELYGIAYTWVEWLEYNIKRALGIEGTTDEDIKLGEAETINTIGRIKYLYSLEKDICDVFNNLPLPDAKNYKTHDDTLCNIDLIFEGGLDDLQHFELPDGYRFTYYHPGDKKEWIDIEMSAGELLSLEQGEECWDRYYGGKENELSRRMVFIVDIDGNKVATATAYYDIHTVDASENGQLHWVSVRKEFQGKGLSKPLITHALKLMSELGYTCTKIHTQTNTWLACKIYYSLGFRPTKESLGNNRFGWKMVGLLTGIDYFGGRV